MHTIRFKGHIAQQDNKTHEVFISRNDNCVARYQYPKGLSGKELRTVVNYYLAMQANMKG